MCKKLSEDIYGGQLLKVQEEVVGIERENFKFRGNFWKLKKRTFKLNNKSTKYIILAWG